VEETHSLGGTIRSSSVLHHQFLQYRRVLSVRTKERRVRWRASRVERETKKATDRPQVCLRVAAIGRTASKPKLASACSEDQQKQRQACQVAITSINCNTQC
jgi:hypothetical protein